VRGRLLHGDEHAAQVAVTPIGLAGQPCTLILQKKLQGCGRLRAKSQAGTIGAGARYTWKWTPATRGSFRLQPTIAARATHTVAKSPWRAFKVAWPEGACGGFGRQCQAPTRIGRWR